MHPESGLRDADTCGLPMDLPQTPSETMTTPLLQTPWRHSTERPDTGRVVWIIERHMKAIYPQSYSIHAGVVQFAVDNDDWRVAQNDETGCGGCSWYPEGSDQALIYENYFAWCYAEEFSFFKYQP